MPPATRSSASARTEFRQFMSNSFGVTAEFAAEAKILPGGDCSRRRGREKPMPGDWPRGREFDPPGRLLELGRRAK